MQLTVCVVLKTVFQHVHPSPAAPMYLAVSTTIVSTNISHCPHGTSTLYYVPS